MKELIFKINQDTELGIIPVENGYSWSYQCIETGVFPDEESALFDWIQWACNNLDEQVIDEDEDEDEDDGNDGNGEDDELLPF